jgi:Flp pilus assembly protein TadD
MAPSETTDLQRLQRLHSYLRQDPRNPLLLAQVCDLALEAGAHDCVRECLAAAGELQLASPQWTGRAIHHSIEVARLHLRSGEPTRSREALEPLLAKADLDAALQAAVQVLWLRATHACGLAREATDWAAARALQSGLQPAAAGVASLAAVDAGDFALAKRLADTALQHGVVLPEVLVARASVALAERDTAAAMRLLQQATAANPDDGRTVSALGMAYLQAGEFAQAQQCFTRAVARMPAHIGSWHGLGWACLLQGDQGGACAAFRQALDLDRNFAESQGAVGLSMLLAGRPDEAKHHLDVADRLDRHNVTGRYARALQSGELRDREALRSLALRLLDRPGLFGANLGEEVGRAIERDLRRSSESL